MISLLCFPFLQSITNGNQVDVITVTTAVLHYAVLCYAVRLMPYAASSGVKLTRVITMLDGFLQP